jgi:hypothetical protein
MTRHGKIARLPKRVRDQLNRRLDDGELGKKLVAWLNGLPEVQDILEVEFDSRPITEQNLSEWKKGGHQDWLRAQESQDFARGLCEEAEDVAEAAGEVSMADHVSTMLSLTLARVIKELVPKAAKSSRVRRELMEIADALVNLRRSDQGSALVRMKQAWHDRELAGARAKDPTLQERLMQAQRKREMEPLNDLAFLASRECRFRRLAKMSGIKPENMAKLREAIGMDDLGPDYGQWLPDSTPATTGSPADPTESKSIQVDQAA